MIGVIKELWCIVFHRTSSLYYKAETHSVGCIQCDKKK